MSKFRLLIVLTVMIPNTLLSQVFTIPYFEDFETGAPGWVATTAGPSNWELGTPSFGTTNSAHSGTNCWEVDLDSGYAGNTNCFLDAPPFNFSGIGSIRISMWQNRNCEANWDGVVLLYRTDTNSMSWNVLGQSGAPGSMNWYNQGSILSSGLPAWTGNSNGWYQSSIVIPNIFGTDDVYFRFRFTSDASVAGDGFSIDDFSIEPDNACFITGNLFLDVNANSVIDAADTPISNMMVTGSFGSNQWLSFSSSNGEYYLVSDTGVVTTVTPEYLLYHTVSPSSHNITINSVGQVSSGNDFLYTPIPGITDVRITHNSTFFRPGFNTTHNLIYSNDGTDTVTGTILFFHDTAVSLVSATAPYTQIAANTIEFNYSNLIPGETRNIQVVTLTDSTAFLGQPVANGTQIYPLLTDTLPFNNSDTTRNFVINSYDPNNKLVDPDGNITPAQVAAGIDLNYTINFQNTGNAPAIHVNVLDVIDDRLDLSTIQIVSTSHPLTSVNIGANRQLHFQFANINLPDSVNNEPASHGFINYRIRPLTSLFEGDEISNTAAIYFDNNLPVITNTVITRVETPVGVSDIAADGQITIYPNPNHGNFTVQFNSGLSFDSWVVYNTLGGKVDSGKVTQQDSFGIRSSSLTPGIYLIQLSGKQVSRTLRFVVH